MNDVCLKKKMPRKTNASSNDYVTGDFRILLMRNFKTFCGWWCYQ